MALREVAAIDRPTRASIGRQILRHLAADHHVTDHDRALAEAALALYNAVGRESDDGVLDDSVADWDNEGDDEGGR